MDPTEISFTPQVLRGWRERFRAEHVGLLLTLSYVFLAAVGMLHEAIIFAIFRINIIEFAEPSDFVLAALRDPIVIVVSLVAVPLVALYYRWSTRMYVKNEGKRKWWMGSEKSRAFVLRNYATLFVFTVVLYGVSFSLLYASVKARRLRDGVGERVRIELVADPSHLTADTTSYLLLGTTQKFLFLYDASKRATTVVPASNVALLLIERRQASR